MRLLILSLFVVIIGSILVTTLSHAQVVQSIRRASLAPGTNEQGESYSYDPEIDGSGRYVIFTSTADNFAAEGVEQGAYHEHVYLRDTFTNTTTQLDVTSSGRTGSPGSSFNTNLRTFGSSIDAHLSRDGKYAVFLSPASDISPDGAGETYGQWAYLKNLETGDIKRIPYATSGDATKTEYPTYLAINGDGSVVVIMSIIGDLSDTTCASCVWELTVYSRELNSTRIVSTGVSGNKFNPGISADGRYVVFENQPGDFSAPTYSYLYDLILEILTPLNGGLVANSPAISGDGAYVAYADTSVIPTVIKLRERESGIESVISNGLNSAEPSGINEFPSLSVDGRYIAFLSTADNLVKNDSNGSDDIFVYDRISGKTTLVSVQEGACPGVVSQEDFNTGPPRISSDGKTVAFTVLERLIPANKKISGTDFTEPADTNPLDDVYFATLDYDATPSVFRAGLTPATPFVSVDCTGSDARIQLEEILTSKAGGNKNTNSKGKKGSSIKKLEQIIIIKKINSLTGRGSVVRRRTAKRNALVTSGLPAGLYSAQVQAKATLNNGKTSQSQLSKAAKFKID